MDRCDRQLLEAYRDGELDAAGRARVERHLAECPECARALAELSELSQMLSGYSFQDITEDELAAVHQAVEDAQVQRVWRIGGSLGLVAASILIVSLAWLNAVPPAPARLRPRMTVSAPAWEQVATTLRAGPLPAGDANPEMRLATSEASDPLLNLMLDGLNNSSLAGKQLP
jgi:anti-sigma factor RsiW